MTLTEALDWAADCEPGDYLIEYAECGIRPEDDPGSRCGFGDDELDAIGRALAARAMKLSADDIGLLAEAA